jgi:hypothetical protein
MYPGLVDKLVIVWNGKTLGVGKVRKEECSILMPGLHRTDKIAFIL